MTGLASTLATIWRLAAPYFRSEDRLAGRLLLAAVVCIELAIVAINVLINQWNARFYNALQDTQLGCVRQRAAVFLRARRGVHRARGLSALSQPVAPDPLAALDDAAAISSDWLDGANHYRMQLLGDAADNPDQRIAEDINLFIEKGLYLGLGLLNSVVTLGSFVVILWVLSASAPFTLFGINWAIPGYLVWAALIYSIAGTAITHWIGRPLIDLNFTQQRYEADFRFNLVRVRENSEQIALLDGEAAENQTAARSLRPRGRQLDADHDRAPRS